MLDVGCGTGTLACRLATRPTVPGSAGRRTRHVVDVAGEGHVEEWVEVTEVDGELATFESPTISHADGERIDSTSTLRFRGEGALRASQREAGYVDVEVRDLP